MPGKPASRLMGSASTVTTLRVNKLRHVCSGRRLARGDIADHLHQAVAHVLDACGTRPFLQGVKERWHDVQFIAYPASCRGAAEVEVQPGESRPELGVAQAGHRIIQNRKTATADSC
jgi:hypothetical protein